LKKMLIIGLFICLALCLSACAKMESSEPDFVLTYAENQAQNYPSSLGGERFAQLVKERTEGKVVIQVKYAGEYGTDEEVVSQMQFGGIDFARVSLAVIADEVPVLNVLQLPFLYKDSTHMWRVLDGKIGQELLDAWAKAGATEENFALLAAQNSVDTGSSSNGGLYENVQQGQMVQAFDAWIFDEARETGNYGLVKTEFGYHLMYYVSGEDAWYLYGLSSSDGLLSMTCYEKITEYSDANPMEVAFDKIVFGMADFSIAEEVAGATEPTEATADTTAATE